MPEIPKTCPQRLLLWRGFATLISVRDLQTVEEELVEISNIGDDTIKFERLIAWSAAHPDEVAFALRFLSGRSKGLADWARRHLAAPDES